MDRRLLTALTLSVLIAMLIVGGLVGWRSMFAPLPERAETQEEAAPTCVEVKRGDVVRSRDVTVTILNAGSRSGLAAQTQQQLVNRGFIAGDVGNAPGSLSNVRNVRVLSKSTKDPAARLVARQFGRKVGVQAFKKDLGPGVEVVVGNDFVGLVKAPRQLKAKSAGPAC